MGLIADPVQRFRQMLADCPHFRTWSGAADANAALARTYIDGLPLPTNADALTADALTALRPYALCYPSEATPYTFRRTAAPNCWNGNGSIACVFSKAYSVTDPTPQWLELAGQIENLIDSGDENQPGLAQLAGRENYLGIQSINVDFVGRTPLADRNDYGDAYDVLLIIEWGFNQQ